MSVTVLNDFICDSSLEHHLVDAKKLGYQFQIRLCFYRTLSLSCIEALSVKVDGIQINPDDISFQLNNKNFLIAELKDLFAEWWYVLDKATLLVSQFGGLLPGKHELEVSTTIRGPYMNYHGDKYLTFTEIANKTLSIS